MPDAGRQHERRPADDRGRRDHATSADRLADHAAIAHLTEDLLPALIAKLSTTQLGELEVREGEWHVRLRRPFGVGPGEGRRATDRPSRTQPGHEGHGHGRAAVESHRPAGRSSGTVAAPASGITAGSGASSAASNGSNARNGAGALDAAIAARDADRHVVTSPAVGIFHPGPKAASGTKVRSGDSLGSVDVLGVRQDVHAPADGIVGSMLAEADTAVEYGQELLRLELTAVEAR